MTATADDTLLSDEELEITREREAALEEYYESIEAAVRAEIDEELADARAAEDPYTYYGVRGAF